MEDRILIRMCHPIIRRRLPSCALSCVKVAVLWVYWATVATTVLGVPSHALQQQVLLCAIKTTTTAASMTDTKNEQITTRHDAIGRWNRCAFVGSTCKSRSIHAGHLGTRRAASLEPKTTDEESVNHRWTPPTEPSKGSSLRLPLQVAKESLQLWIVCLGATILLISWEDVSMIHPIRQEAAAAASSSLLLSSPSLSTSSSSSSFRNRLGRWGTSTVRGMAFGRRERLALSAGGVDLEAGALGTLPSYNEVMLRHRVDRVAAKWRGGEISRNDVTESVRTLQRALLRLQDCKRLANNYDYEGLRASLAEPLFRSDLEGACYVLKRADGFLSREVRNEIGFDWGSCAWRHCGALADAQEALDELDHLLGVLEPFECLFCLDVVERSVRDILALTKEYQDATLPRPEYQPINRANDVTSGVEQLDRMDDDYLNTLSFLRNTIF
jgi:hypothetical protein